MSLHLAPAKDQYTHSTMTHDGDEEDTSDSANVESLEIFEDEIEDDFDIPPFSSCVMAWRRWCKFTMWPAVFLLVNVIAFSTLLVFDRREYSFDSPKKRTAERIAMFQTNTAITSIILFIDCAVLLKAAFFMEKEMLALDRVEEDTRVAGHYPSNHLYAQASRKMDNFFQKRHRPRVSFFVSVLYFAAILCGAVSVGCFGLRGYSAFGKMKRDCAIVNPGERRDPKTKKPIDGLPDELQQWARRWKTESDEMSSSFIRLNDGRTFFQGLEKMANETDENVDVDDYTIYNSLEYRPTLISTAKDGTIQNHRNVLDPRYFTSVKGNSEIDSQAFCCSYTERRDMDKRERSFRRDTGRHLLCVTSSEDVSDEFRNISLPAKTKNGARMVQNQREAKVKAYNGELYFEYTTYDHDYTAFQTMFAQMEIYKVNPDTMRVESIANVTGEENMGTVISGDGSGSACNIWIDAIGTSLAAIVVFPASYWLLKKKQMPSGFALAVLMLFEIIGDIANDDFANALGFVTAVAASICLLGIVKVPRLISREMLVWAYYAVICYFLLTAWKNQSTARRELQRYGSSTTHKHRLEIPWWSFALLSSIVGVLLNHPVLQVSGWVGGIAMVFHGLLGTLVDFGGRRSPYDDDDMLQYGSTRKHGDLWMVPAGVVIGCGLVALGHTLTKYRAYVVYYLKKLWRATANAASVGRGGDDLTTGLLRDD